MSIFTGSLNYGLDDVIKVRVTAYNDKGESDAVSDESTGAGAAKVVPQQMPSNSITYGEETSEY